MRILIVDDSVDNRALLESILGAAGYSDLITAESAADTFALLGMSDTSSVSEPVDLILMDIRMPDMDGIQACREIKKTASLRDIPIVMVTSLDESDSWRDAFEAGAMDYIAKPLRTLELLPRVRSALALKGEMDARKLAYDQLGKSNKELQAALVKVKLLSGLLPICCYCKKIRNDAGYWNQVEVYIKEHSQANFSHGICPDCMLERHPRAYRRMLQEDEGRDVS